MYWLASDVRPIYFDKFSAHCRLILNITFLQNLACVVVTYFRISWKNKWKVNHRITQIHMKAPNEISHNVPSKFIIVVIRRNECFIDISSVIRQNGESQNGGNKKTKHANFFEKLLFLTSKYAQMRMFSYVFSVCTCVNFFVTNNILL